MGDVDDVGFSSTAPAEGYGVCANCFEDPVLKRFISDKATSTTCSFCNRESRKKPIAAPLDEVVELMLEAINREFEHAVEALGWDGQEGGYQGSYCDSHDLLAYEIGIELPNDDDERLLSILADLFR